MRTASILAMAAALLLSAGCADETITCPDVIRIEGDRFHVQGIALDSEKGVIYSSFTNVLTVSDLNGNLKGSVTGITGHLGDIAFDPEKRVIYASLEFKDDAIGKAISQKIGEVGIQRSQSRFYIAEIYVDKITGPDIPLEDASSLYPVAEAGKDYMETVTVKGIEKEHRYGCSGIDGVALAPAFGEEGKKEKYLYVAYGIYGDTTRTDNDYNILLRYDLADLTVHTHKYFIHTGNTTYGIQNLAYDSFTDRMYLAVYKGKKKEYPNYGLFAIDMSQSPCTGQLQGVPYHTEEAEQVKICEGWHFKWGSTGLTSLGEGLYYISEDGKEDGRHYCNATLYTASDSPEAPFTRNYDTEKND